ncbi:aminoacetone oxidase family FAD-binding enzyme [Leptotrichia sp. oral taxon 847]|uniref:aminoacetone oxidase family FAD-binding enzyme n=1 Tax=Leptotrichia sp. oral taxon 847 TaxID=1785996 RepID=UPI0007684B0B|nr:aminoacetone oxidase family FAD-binding enzyme [Leptotrichia sp. oral taxon 847]AMD95405.1 flavoprotein [Leptotrichia sp. oral taxon 847]
MKTEVTVIGGGAAGLMAAITAKKNGRDVVILERKDRILKKVLVTGNGRCNLSNINATNENYFGIENRKQDINHILNNFLPNDVIDFFENEIGIICNEESRGKLYPLSGQAASIVDGLRFYAQKLGIPIYTDFYVTKVTKEMFEFKILSEDKRQINSKKIILATGGISYPELGSNGSGYQIAKNFGHSLTKLVPAIVQLKTEKHKIKGLRGIKLDTKVTAFGKNEDKFEKICTYEGELLFTDYGISGNVVFNISFVFPLYKEVEFEVDFMTKFEYDELFKILKKRREILKNMTMEQYFNGMINKKLGQFLTKMSGIPKLSKNISELTDNEIKKICTILKKYKIKILDTNGFKNAQVTAGGIPLNEINLENLESKKTKGLYFAGEVMDVYGECGGFNLHWAWASGKFAGENV